MSGIAVALPPLALAALTVAMLLAAVAGRHPMWHVPEFNLSEAAGSRDAASVVWLILRGEDPNAPRAVRAGIIDTRQYPSMTPIEAALESRRVEIVHLLLQRGAVVDEARRAAYTCKAKSRGDDDIVKYFESRGGPVPCPERAR